MLFQENTKKAMRIAMFIVGILIIISMVAFYVPIV